MLSKGIQDFIESTERLGGVDTKSLPADTLLAVHTQNSVYWVLFVDADKGIVVIQDQAMQRFPDPAPCLLHGATAGGSMVKIGWICFGSRVRFEYLDSGILVTSAIKPRGITVHSDESDVRVRLRAAYDAYQAKPKVTLEEFVAKMEEIIQRFPEPKQRRVRGLVANFCPEGQLIVLTFLEQAQAAEKLAEGLKILEGQMRSHWQYKHPAIRGRIMTPSDDAHVRALYTETGISLPQ